MARFKIKILLDNRPLVRAKGDRISDFDNLFKDLKKKFRDDNGY